MSGASEHILLLRRRRKEGLDVKAGVRSLDNNGSGGMAEWFKAAVLPARGGSAFGGKTGYVSSLICLVFIFYIAEA